MASMQRLPTEILLEIVNYLGHLHEETLNSFRDEQRYRRESSFNSSRTQECHLREETFKSCRNQELANLRRTCKTLADVAAVPLFSTISVWLERDSLNKLLEYSKHALIRTSIKRLEIGGQRVSPYLWNTRNPDWAELDRHRAPKDLEQLHEWADGKFVGIPFTLKHGDSNVDRPSIISDAKDAIDRLDFQKRMELDFLDIDLLSEAFREMPNLMSLVFEYTHSPPGSWKLAQSGFEVYDSGIPWRCHVFQVILQALSKAKCKPREIAWQNESVVGGLEGLPIWALNDITPLLIDPNQMVHLLSNVIVLSLENIWGDITPPVNRHFDGIDPSQALSHIIESCPQLEELHLDFGEVYTGFTRENLMGKGSNAKLRRLTLECICIDAFQLALCITTNKSLERVRLALVFFEKGHWKSFLDHVKAKFSPSLKAFQLIDLDLTLGGPEVLVEDYCRNRGYYEEEFALEYIQGKTDRFPPLCQTPDVW